MSMWEPRRLTTLWASIARYTESFIFLGASSSLDRLVTPPGEPIMQLVHEYELIPSPKIDPLLFLGLKGYPLLLFLGWNETISN
jgi:hypothetical protein